MQGLRRLAAQGVQAFPQNGQERSGPRQREHAVRLGRGTGGEGFGGEQQRRGIGVFARAGLEEGALLLEHAHQRISRFARLPAEGRELQRYARAQLRVEPQLLERRGL